MLLQSAAQKLASLPETERSAILEELSEEECEALLYDWRGFNARPDQVAPDGDWDIWLALAGRGWGKTRTGAEWIKEEIDAGRARRIALVAETAADGRDVMVEGESGILSIYPDHKKPLYEPSKRRVTWGNGAIATLFNATEPEQLRGPQFDLAWCDELAKWRYARETWDQLQFGLRLGKHPRVLATTTPKPIQLVKAIVAGEEGKVHVTRGRTLDNASNLATPFMRKIMSRYDGTRLGRQELDGEILGDIPNALWTYASLETSRVRTAPEQLGTTYVSVDPAAKNNPDSDEHGITVVAASMDGKEAYVLEDGSIKGSPKEWAQMAIDLHDKYEADGIVVETNQGGDMVAHTIKSVRNNVNVVEVTAWKGKHLRAEPISSLYAQGRIHHVGAFPELETQMTQMTTHGYEGDGSPDRLDSLVHGMTKLFPSLALKKKKKREAKAIPTATPMARRRR
jgi:phage terminase large subunit-like protein